MNHRHHRKTCSTASVATKPSLLPWLAAGLLLVGGMLAAATSQAQVAPAAPLFAWGPVAPHTLYANPTPQALGQSGWVLSPQMVVNEPTPVWVNGKMYDYYPALPLNMTLDTTLAYRSYQNGALSASYSPSYRYTAPMLAVPGTQDYLALPGPLQQRISQAIENTRTGDTAAWQYEKVSYTFQPIEQAFFSPYYERTCRRGVIFIRSSVHAVPDHVQGTFCQGNAGWGWMG